MPKDSDNLNLKLYDNTTDSSVLPQSWFDNSFGFNDSNLIKIDNAYKKIQDRIDDAPTKTGINATGTWDIDVSGSANSTVADGAGNDINSTYISEIEVNDTSISCKKGDGVFVFSPIKTDKTLSVKGMMADAKAVGDMLKKITYSTLIIKTEVGSTVTVSKGTRSYTDTTNQNGEVKFTLPAVGKWDIVGTLNGKTATDFVDVDTVGQTYNVNLIYFEATLTVSSPTGSVVTVTYDKYKFTKTVEANDEVVFNITHFGSYAASATTADGTILAKKTVNIFENEQSYFTSLYHIFGVVWDYSNPSTSLIRLTTDNDPNNYVTENLDTEPSPAIGSDGGSSPFDNYYPWNKMEEYNIVNNAVGAKYGESGFSRSSNDVVVYIPEFWYKIIDDADNSKRYFYISGATIGFEKHPGSGKYVGKYNANTDNYSRTGSSPYTNMTRATARSGAKGKGDKWSLYDYSSWCAVWLLYLVEYADWDSQTKIGKGLIYVGRPINSGGTDTMTYHTGRAAGTNDYAAVQYRHIENLWGNVSEWIDGVNFSDGTVYTCTDYTKYADDTSSNYTNIGAEIQSNGYITKIGYSTTAPWSFYPTAVNGSATTYIPDYAYCQSGWRMLCVGGYYNGESGAGLFCFYASDASSDANTTLGFRLLFNP